MMYKLLMHTCEMGISFVEIIRNSIAVQIQLLSKFVTDEIGLIQMKKNVAKMMKSVS